MIGFCPSCGVEVSVQANDRRRAALLLFAARFDSFSVKELQEAVRLARTTDMPSPHSTATHVREWLRDGLVRKVNDPNGGYRYWWIDG
jgi:hypothetical protein